MLVAMIFPWILAAGLIHTASQAGTVLHVGCRTANPAMVDAVYEGNGTVKLKGFAGDLWDWISVDQEISYEFVKINSTEGFQGFLRALTSGVIDVGVESFALLSGRNKMVTYIFPFNSGYHSLLIPYPKRQSDPWSCFKPYELTVWILILVSMLAITITAKVVSYYEYCNKATQTRTESKFQSEDLNYVYVVGVLTNQGGYFSSKARSSRLLAAVWCIGALVLVNAYSGSLITYMTTPKILPIVSSIEELAARDDIQLVVPSKDAARYYIQTSVGNLEPLARNLGRVPEDLCGISVDDEEYTKCLEKISKGEYVLASNAEEIMARLQRRYNNTGACDLTMLEHPFYPWYAAMIASLNVTHQLRNALDVSTLSAASYGLTSRWRNLALSSFGRNPCQNFKSQTQVQSIKKMTLTDMTSAFVLLGLGCASSFIIFLYEALRAKYLQLLTQR